MSYSRQLLGNDQVVCHCYGVTRSQITELAETGQAETLPEVREATCAGAGCTACHCRIKRLLQQANRKAAIPLETAPAQQAPPTAVPALQLATTRCA